MDKNIKYGMIGTTLGLTLICGALGYLCGNSIVGSLIGLGLSLLGTGLLFYLSYANTRR